MLNSETYFSQAARADIQRSAFDRSHSLHTDFSTGELVPLDVQPVLPGDTITMDFSHVTRGATPIAPVMDNAVLDIYAFFCPNRLIWDHWVNFMGQNDSTHWEQPVEYHTPKIEAPSGGWASHSLADYLGVVPGVEITVNALRFRGYAAIWNEWFRDENLKDPCYITKDETTVTGVNKGVNYDYVTDIEKGAACAKVAKLHDYFTSALPEPLKGPDVYVPLGKSAPVIGAEPTLDAQYPDYVAATNLIGKELTAQTIDSNKIYAGLANDADIGDQLGDGITTSQRALIKLEADLSNAIGATINSLRLAFAIQRYFEANARTGTRYTEIIDGIFHVQSPDARQQRPEFLGAKRFPINIDQVLQTSATDAISPQGNTGAYSVTVNADNLFTYSATEHGYLYILGCVRTVHTYAQGIDKDLLRDKKLDYYVPQLANIGEVPIKNIEIYAQDDTVVDADTGEKVNDQVFGYQEAWAEYRYSPNVCTGLMRPQVNQSLAIWNYADNYNSLPYLSGDWIDETDTNVARTMAVKNQPQWIMNAYFKAKWVRPMPTFSIPGLIDHH